MRREQANLNKLHKLQHSRWAKPSLWTRLGRRLRKVGGLAR